MFFLPVKSTFMVYRDLCQSVFVVLLMLVSAVTQAADSREPELLFYVSAKESLNADIAAGENAPNFRDKIQRVPTGIVNENGEQGWAIEWADDGVLSWDAPSNIQAQRGTLSFFWRSRYAVGEAPFVLFRVGYADHTSWDMAWMRIDWNGEGFDAFVTDANLARTRVSFALPQAPAADEWLHLAFSWDETQGVVFYVNGKEAARKGIEFYKAGSADFDSGLDQFGLAGRVLSPHQVQSRYNFLRGSDFAEIRIYDRMLDNNAIANLSRNDTRVSADGFDTRKAWLFRHGWNERQAPPLLKSPTTTFRKVEFTDARDLKQWMWKATDGIAETTWPGVYNRSRLPGRDDYFQLPDWNTYVEGGKNLDLTLPSETVNRIELRGAAFGELLYRPNEDAQYRRITKRPPGVVRSVYEFDAVTGGELRFANSAQETPIQEIQAYHVSDAAEPQGVVKQTYTIRSNVRPDFDNLASLRDFIAGRYAADEQATVIALPRGANARRRDATDNQNMQPFVHILIPSSVSYPPAGKAVTRSWAYGWENMYHGLDGIAIDLPALPIKATHGGVIPLNIRVKDPIWPARDMIDISVSVKPGEARTLWLDMRDRILTDDSFYITIASASPEFSAQLLDGADIRLVFKERKDAIAEHTQDRFSQVRDNWGFLVEEHTTSQRQRSYQRAHKDISDLLRVDPDHEPGRTYWNYMSYNSQGGLPFTQPEAPQGMPLWAFRQTEDLKLARYFINWWIDQRQVEYGDFGGGISDDSDMVQQWPGMALMGVDEEKINHSLTALADAAYRNGMFTNGLNTIETDELHTYEEGINTNSAMLYINWGDPLTLERLMETARAYDRIILPNPQGNLLFASNWYGGNKIYREPNWSWQKPYSFPMIHPLLVLGEFNADRRSYELITGLSDGYMAYAYIAEDGQWVLPNEINWHTGETRGGEMTQGAGSGDVPNLFWAAWRWTGEERYLKPLDYRLARGGPGALSRLNENVLDVLDKREAWGEPLVKSAKKGATGFEGVVAWESTGDKKFLEEVFGWGIQFKTQRMYLMTEGHWWTDRVEASHNLLQRTRLGGVALSRNFFYPGHTVSWSFEKPDDAVNIAILIPRPDRKAFKVIAHNLSAETINAQMTGWNITPGKWRVIGGVDTTNNDQPDAITLEREFLFEKSRDVALAFPSKQTLVLNFELIEETSPVEQRPDVGIGRGDVEHKGNTLFVTVHSLGHQDAPQSRLMLEDEHQNVIAEVIVPAMPAPVDLKPVTSRIALSLPKGFDVNAGVLRLEMEEAEITLLNNRLELGKALAEKDIPR